MVDAFSLPGSRPLGCLLVHGFTGTPEEMRPLGEALAARGFPVHAVRLAGHGTDVAELARTRSMAATITACRWPTWSCCGAAWGRRGSRPACSNTAGT